MTGSNWVDIECEDCLGQGYVTEQCGWCDGGDNVAVEDGVCTECVGTGTVIVGDCLRCEGAGWWSVPARPGSVGEQR